jgi:hypothetical protein
MSPKRGDRVAPPPLAPEWELRFLTAEAVKGWDELCREAPGNVRKAFEIIRADAGPPIETARHHRPRADLALGTRAGVQLHRWQYEVTGGGRIWYLVDPEALVAWFEYCGTGHPNATDRKR